MEEYEASREFDDLKQFAEEKVNLWRCGPANLEFCDDAKKADLEKWMKMSDAEFETAMKEEEKTIEQLESRWDKIIDGLGAKLNTLKAASKTSKKSGDEGGEETKSPRWYEDSDD